MKRLLCMALAFAPLVHAADTARPRWKSLDATLEPQKMLEHCEHLDKGDKRLFSWKANAPVDFNIHYHDGPEVIYPLKRDGMRGDGGTFIARTAQDYCWMWTARNATARIQGKVEIKPE